MDHKINVAILGAGNIARSMAQALNGISDEVTAYAVASRSLEKAEAFKEKWGLQVAYGSYEELAKDDNVDLVYIATPHSEHYRNAKLCLENGRNCLVEKAFCGNRRQAQELIDLAHEKGLFLAEAMWTRYQPSRKIIADIIKSGKIGRLLYVESDFSVSNQYLERMVNPALAGGALLDLGIYSLTVPDMFIESDIEKVDISMRLTDTGVDETTVVEFEYADGVKAKVKCSSGQEPYSNYAKIIGEEGSMFFKPINAPDIIEIYDKDGDLVEQIKPPVLVNFYEYEVLECKKAMQEGRLEPYSITHEVTMKLMKWMDLIRFKGGVVYPFETKEELAISDEEAFKTAKSVTIRSIP